MDVNNGYNTSRRSVNLQKNKTCCANKPRSVVVYSWVQIPVGEKFFLNFDFIYVDLKNAKIR